MVKISIFICILFLFNSCTKKPYFNNSLLMNISETCGILVKVDYRDENYNGFRSSMGDRKTKDDWEINYLVRNDSTRYKDVFIGCSKGDLERTFEVNGAFSHPNFMPKFIGENKDCFFFIYSCSSSCKALLIFNKKEKDFKEYAYIVDYDIKKSLLVYTPQQESWEPLKLKIVDLANQKEMDVFFINRCMSSMSFKKMCIDKGV
jgi:hypothetical protein